MFTGATGVSTGWTAVPSSFAFISVSAEANAIGFFAGSLDQLNDGFINNTTQVRVVINDVPGPAFSLELGVPSYPRSLSAQHVLRVPSGVHTAYVEWKRNLGTRSNLLNAGALVFYSALGPVGPTGAVGSVGPQGPQGPAGPAATGDAGSLNPNDHQTLRQLIHFIDGGPGAGFPSGAYRETSGVPFPTGITWWTSASKTEKLVEKLISMPLIAPTAVTWNMFATGGALVQSLTDHYVYTGVFEVSRLRSIS